MKVLIPVNDDKLTICPVFARAPFFMIYNDATVDCVDNPATNTQGGAGLKAAQFVVDQEVDAVITPRLGENAADVFHAAEIKIYLSNGDDAKANAQMLLKNKLEELTHFHSGFVGKQ